MNNPFTSITEQVQAADRLPTLLSAVYVGLELADLTTHALTEDGPAEHFPAYMTA
jgi:hypothetical protein